MQADGGDIRATDGSNNQLPADLIGYDPDTDSGRLDVNTAGKVELHLSANGTTDSVATSDSVLLLDSPNLIIVSRDATAGEVAWIINGRLEPKITGLLTGPVATPTADFYVSGVRHVTLNAVIQQIRGAVAAVVIQKTATFDETVADYLRAVYGVN